MNKKERKIINENHRIQLPPQDSDPLCCGPLTRSEEKELKAFDEARKRRALGEYIQKFQRFFIKKNVL